MTIRLVVIMAVLGCGLAAPVRAQTPPVAMVEVITGWAGFVDENWIDRTMVGVAARVYVTERIAVGPEFVFLRGANDEYDWTLTGNATIDLVRDTGPMAPAFVPYVVVGGGYLRQVTQTGTRQFTSSEGTASAGAGVRLRLGQRAFIAPEIRVGYEPELRFGATLGWSPGR